MRGISGLNEEMLASEGGLPHGGSWLFGCLVNQLVRQSVSQLVS